jgi:OFA family oxalate/formate antiporter-like MFS transporter
VPEAYPFDKDTVLVEKQVKVAVKKEFDEEKDEYKPSASDISASGAKWTKTQATTVFSAGLAFFAILMVLAGRLMPKVGPRNLAMAGGVVLGVGYLLAGLLGSSNFIVTFICVGVIGGSGIGLAYVVPIAVGMRWFPDKKGLITGLAVAGFGFGALLWVKLAGSWGGLLGSIGLDTTFIIYGIAFMAAVVVGGIWMIFPPEGWKPEGWEPPQATGSTAAATGSVEIPSGQMLGMPQFYMIFLTFAFGASAGLMSIGLMKLFPMSALQAAGVDAVAASAMAGTAMAVFFSLANGIGRIAWGTISDYIGAKMAIITMMATQGIFVILFQFMASNEYALYLGATLIGFNFGGNFALFPMITAGTFGTKYIGQNYGWVFLAYGAGGIFGPILGGKLGDMGNFPLAFTICGVLCLLAAGIIGVVKPPKVEAVEA